MSPKSLEQCDKLAEARKWRNGRRSGLKIRRPSGHEGSNPSFRTIYQPLLSSNYSLFLFAYPRCTRVSGLQQKG